MTTEEKLAAVEASGLPLAYDGCHKIYFLEDEGRQREAAACGYAPFLPAAEIRRLVVDSCGLVFVSRWGHDNDDFAHPWNIPQFDPDLAALRAAAT